MAEIKIPDSLLAKIGPDMKMDTHWIDVKLKDGRIFRRLVVRGGQFITGRHCDPNGEGVLSFDSDDVADIRPQSLLTIFVPCWPFW